MLCLEFLTNNKSFKSPASIQSDNITYTQLEKIFGSYKDSLDNGFIVILSIKKHFSKSLRLMNGKLLSMVVRIL